MINLLITDDEQMERALLTEIVQTRFGADFQVQQAENGRRAVEIAAQWPAEMILMDIEMPGISGIDAARQILVRQPECKIIFITAYGLFSYAREAINLGACDYILKPVDPDYVEQAIRRAASQIESQRQLTDDGQEVALAERIIGYLQHNYMRSDLSARNVSALMDMDETRFSLWFRQVFAEEFESYLLNLRVEAAKTLLADPLRSTAEAAGMVGYDSDGAFIRDFRKVTGQSPREFRRSCAAGREGGRA